MTIHALRSKNIEDARSSSGSHSWLQSRRPAAGKFPSSQGQARILLHSATVVVRTSGPLWNTGDTQGGLVYRFLILWYTRKP